MVKYNSNFIKKISMLKNKNTEDFVTLPNGKQCQSCTCSHEDGFFTLKNNEWKQFWKDCKKYFPYQSVNGISNQTKESIIQTEREYVYSKLFNMKINSLYSKKVLEIGYGYGGLGLELMEKFNVEYYGIDYIASDKKLLNLYNNAGEKCFIEINKSGIPNNLKNKTYNFVISINVFQHLTQQQRFEYIKEAYNCLETGGYLIFDVFSYNWKCGKKRWNKWQTYFFNVTTYIDYDKELQSFIKETGFKIINCKDKRLINNTTFVKLYLCQK